MCRCHRECLGEALLGATAWLHVQLGDTPMSAGHEAQPCAPGVSVRNHNNMRFTHLQKHVKPLPRARSVQVPFHAVPSWQSPAAPRRCGRPPHAADCCAGCASWRLRRCQLSHNAGSGLQRSCCRPHLAGGLLGASQDLTAGLASGASQLGQRDRQWGRVCGRAGRKVGEDRAGVAPFG